MQEVSSHPMQMRTTDIAQIQKYNTCPDPLKALFYGLLILPYQHDTNTHFTYTYTIKHKECFEKNMTSIIQIN